MRDRKSGFALDSSAWGKFDINITVYLTDGSEEYMTYPLDLSKPLPPQSEKIDPSARW